MRLSVVTTTPEVMAPVPVALLSGSFAERLEKAARAGCAGVEMMVLRPAELFPRPDPNAATSATARHMLPRMN